MTFSFYFCNAHLLFVCNIVSVHLQLLYPDGLDNVLTLVLFSVAGGLTIREGMYIAEELALTGKIHPRLRTIEK